MTTVDLDAPAPDFALDDIAGQRFSLSAARGRPVLLVFNRGFS